MRLSVALVFAIPAWLSLVAADAPVAPTPPNSVARRLAPTAAELDLFHYDAKAPLEVEVVSTEKKNGLTIETLSYASPKGGRVPAVVIIPAGTGPFPAVIVQHGVPETKADMMPEAIALAERGAVALLIDAPFARSVAPGGNQEVLHFDERDRDMLVQLAVDWRRGVDLLHTRRDVDPKRLAFVGYSFGAAHGGILAGIEKRLKAYVFMSGDGGLISHFTGPDDKPGPLGGLTPEKRQRWLAAMQQVEPIRYIGRAAPARLLFQNGRKDPLVPITDAEAYQGAGSMPKTTLWYDAGHSLNADAKRDRYAWLAKQIGIKP